TSKAEVCATRLQPNTDMFQGNAVLGLTCRDNVMAYLGMTKPPAPAGKTISISRACWSRCSRI
ncbi:MAG: hypothetical protein ACRD3O_21330, partial [Terriglobia bacterium]